MLDTQVQAPASPPVSNRDGRIRAPAAAPEALLVGSLAVSTSVGVLMVAIADAGTRAGAAIVGSWAYWLFWAGLAVVFAPVAIAVCTRELSSAVRLGLVVVVAAGLYLIKVIYSPTQMAFSDEFAHWRTAHDIVATGHLFHGNPLLPVAAHYPGLGIVTSALVKLGGMSISTAEFVVIGVARLVMTISLYLILARLTRRARVAVLGSLLYMVHPNYFYFDAQAAYESLALPIAALCLALLLRGSSRRSHNRIALEALAVVLILSVAVIHHVTSYALAGSLTLWAGVAFVRRRRGFPAYIPWWPAAIAVAATVTWLLLVAPTTIGYLGPVLSRAVNQSISVALGHTHTRPLYRTPSGEVSPLWERIAGFAGVAVLVFLLLRAVPQTRRLWKRHPLTPVLIAAAALYPVILILRFVPDAQETANRASAYVFLGVALLGGRELVHLIDWRPWRQATVAALLGIAFIGGITSAWAFYQRMPSTSAPVPLGPTSENVAAALWADHAEGPNHVTATDKADRLAFGSFGEQDPVFGANGNVPVWGVFLPRTINAALLQLLEAARVHFVVVDERLSHGPPPEGGYFDTGEPLTYGATHPIPAQALNKFATSPDFELLYDNGPVKVYQVVSTAPARSASAQSLLQHRRG